MVRGGGHLCSRPVISSADGKYLFVAVAEAVRVFSTVTGLLVSALKGHLAYVTACVPNPRNDTQVGHAGLRAHRRWQQGCLPQSGWTAQVYTASQDGCVILWDFAEGEVAKEYKTGLHIAHMVRFLPPCPGADMEEPRCAWCSS